jgi:tRNA G10  N-methylase Trm11
MSDWRGLYSEGWTGEIVPDAFAHPAKYARGLIRHIYDHATAEGWLKPGDTVLDPFGGVALGALDAMRHGLNWWGNELEQRFVELGAANIDMWNERYRPHFPRWGTATLTQGDSRNLAGALVDAAISSPPYAEARIGGTETMRRSSDAEGDYGSTPGQLGVAKQDDFWTAARQIVEQVHALLKPGGVAIWVVKAYVKKGKRIDFPGQWRELCEAVGFETLHQHRAWVVEGRGTQLDIFGNAHTRQVERKSFFRRLAEAKGSPRIDWEDVICTRRTHHDVQPRL